MTFLANGIQKPFNALLGETFEIVTDEFSYLSEKVQHMPNPVNASYCKGKNFLH